MQLESLARALGLQLEGDPNHEIHGLAGLADAGSFELSFVASLHHQKAFRASKGGAFILPEGFDREGRTCLRSAAPYVDFGRAVEIFLPRASPQPGIHPTAIIEADVRLGEDISVGPYVVIGLGSSVGDRCVLHPHVTVYPDVSIGADCEIHSGAHLRQGVRLGDCVVIQSGAVIGGEGFGYAFLPDGRRVRIPHRCGVELGNEVEVGSNSTIDAAHPGHPRHGHAEGGTRIGAETKLDNLVQIGHGVAIGERSTVCASAAVSGGVRVGNGVYLGGGTIYGGGSEIGDGSFVGAGSGVLGTWPPGSQLLGRPAVDRRLFARIAAAWKRLPELLRRVRRIERRLGMEREGD